MGEEQCGLFNKRCWEKWTGTCQRIKLDHSRALYTKADSQWSEVLSDRPETGTPWRKQRLISLSCLIKNNDSYGLLNYWEYKPFIGYMCYRNLFLFVTWLFACSLLWWCTLVNSVLNFNVVKFINFFFLMVKAF